MCGIICGHCCIIIQLYQLQTLWSFSRISPPSLWSVVILIPGFFLWVLISELEINPLAFVHHRHHLKMSLVQMLGLMGLMNLTSSLFLTNSSSSLTLDLCLYRNQNIVKNNNTHTHNTFFFAKS